MGIFSGVGGSYVARGLAQALDQVPITQRMLEDRARRQALEDEQLSAWRDDRATKTAQEQRQNARQDAQDAQNAVTFSQESASRAHALSRQPIEDTQHDTQFDLGKQLTEGDIAMLPLKRREALAAIAAHGSAMQTAALQRQGMQYQLQNAQLDLMHRQAVQDADKTAAVAASTGDPTVWADFFRAHGPPGHDINIVPAAKGGWDVQHYAAPPSGGPPQLINTRHFDDLDAFKEQADQIVEPDFYRKLQATGLAKPNYTIVPGQDGGGYVLNHRTGALQQALDAKGKPIAIRDPNAFMNGMGATAAPAPTAGSGFIRGALGNAPVGAAPAAQQPTAQNVLDQLSTEYGY